MTWPTDNPHDRPTRRLAKRVAFVVAWMAISAAILMLCSCATVPHDAHGIPNYAEVAPSLYRGGEPTAEGWKYLQSLGVGKSLRLDYAKEKPDNVIMPSDIMDVEGSIPPEDLGDLIKEPSQKDLILRATWIDAAMHRYKPDPLLSGLADKTEAQVGLYLGALLQKSCPVFVHCLHGKDRTGIVIAYYRVLFCGWTKAKAEKEMLSLGFRKANVGLWEAWEHFKP